VVNWEDKEAKELCSNRKTDDKDNHIKIERSPKIKKSSICLRTRYAHKVCRLIAAWKWKTMSGAYGQNFWVRRYSFFGGGPLWEEGKKAG
jgi:hypothetical protein